MTPVNRSTAFVKTCFAAALLVMASLGASAQKATVLDALSRNGVDASVLDPKTLEQPEDYAYSLNFTSTAAGKTTSTQARFDPTALEGDRWTVESVNGKPPSRSDISSFRKDHAKQKAETRPDDATYKVEKETPDNLVISYKVDPSSLTKDAAFMKDCRSYLTINLHTKRVEQVQAQNEKPVKINILTADRLNVTVKYTWNDQAKHYFTQTENMTMDAKFLGQATNVETNSVYTNYKKP